jgi:hypothetical protein
MISISICIFSILPIISNFSTFSIFSIFSIVPIVPIFSNTRPATSHLLEAHLRKPPPSRNSRWHSCRWVADDTPQASGISGGKIATDSKGGGIGRSVGGFIDPKLSWKDIEWLRKHTKLPIGLKGVQSVEDAKKAAAMGIEAIYLSNHG